mmetsp:Transcript_22310/g.51571  ORF Transcript_22310/g.51571 Transcript_22310/m.51571 type:complete len:232 (+) Transcript_22310:1943-2638(+)
MEGGASCLGGGDMRFSLAVESSCVRKNPPSSSPSPSPSPSSCGKPTPASPSPLSPSCCVRKNPPPLSLPLPRPPSPSSSLSFSFSLTSSSMPRLSLVCLSWSRVSAACARALASLSSIESVFFFFTTTISVLVVSFSGPRSLRLSAALCLSESSWLALFFTTRALAAFRCSTRAFRRASCSNFACSFRALSSRFAFLIRLCAASAAASASASATASASALALLSASCTASM